MKRIEVAGMAPGEFVERIKGAIAGRELGKIVGFRSSPQEIVVVFSKLGTTEITYDVRSQGDGFVATLASEKVAFTHKPFKADMAAKLVSVMQRIGAKVS